MFERWFFAVVLGSVACTTVHHRIRSEDELRTVAAAAEGRTATITLASGQALPVGGLKSEGTRLRWAAPAPGGAAWSDVREASVVRHDLGFLQGAGLGAILGFALGGVVGFVAGTSCTPDPPPAGDPPGNCPLDSRPSFGGGLRAGALLGLTFAIPAALIGGIIGALRGSRSVFTSLEATPAPPPARKILAGQRPDRRRGFRTARIRPLSPPPA